MTDREVDALKTRLLLIGGGPRPVEAMRWFARAAGHGTGRVLVVAWASQAPFSACRGYREELHALGLKRVMVNATPPATMRERKHFLHQLKRSTAIFFTGGDQNRVLDVLKDPVLHDALHACFARGVVFGGTSAGTAIMSSISISGDPSAADEHTPVRNGLGALRGAVVDQHFIKRGRHARLANVVERHPHLVGLGVDEEAALAVEDGRTAVVLGSQKVLMMRRISGNVSTETLHPGDVLDLSSLSISRASVDESVS